MRYCKTFSEIRVTDVAQAGGKGASLGEMTAAGIPVPPGFVVRASAFAEFLDANDLHAAIQAELAKVDPKVIHTLEHAAETVRAIILRADLPRALTDEITAGFAALQTDVVAVRSSATSEDGADAAWAGQLESFLNTPSNTLLDTIKRCWASLFTPRAIFYRHERGLTNSNIGVAVVVQKMVQSNVSGVAFSVHPITKDHNQLIIEAGRGLGEAIVSGQITPDSYVVQKHPRAIIDTYVAHQERALVKAPNGGNKWITLTDGVTQKLSNEQVHALADLVLRIEAHYGFPCDIEWALENTAFFITQSRPITTLTK